MSFKSKNLLLLEQNTEEIEEDISIVKLNISNLHNAFIPQLKSTETLTKKLLSYILFNQNRSLHNSFDTKTWRLQIILSGVLLRSVRSAGNFNMLSNKGFLASKKERSITAHSW